MITEKTATAKTITTKSTTVKSHNRLLTSAFCACLFCLVTLCGKCPSAHATTALQPGQISAFTSQRFFCTVGYDSQRCAQHVARLKQLLVQYAAGTQEHWSWVVVRSEDWEPLMLNLHLDRRSPAFSALGERKTFLEESLFLPSAKRAGELQQTFGAPIDQLLPIAVSHELGHAVCRDGNEDAANQVAQQLRSGKRPQCVETAKSLTPIQQLYLDGKSHAGLALHPH